MTRVEGIKAVRTIFSKAWGIDRKYSFIGDTDEEWAGFVAECDELYGMYEGTAAGDYAKQIALATLRYIDSIYKKEAGQNNFNQQPKEQRIV